MKFKPLFTLALLLGAFGLPAHAEDTLKKVTESGRLALAYRESSVPFSYLVGAGKPVAGLIVTYRLSACRCASCSPDG